MISEGRIRASAGFCLQSGPLPELPMPPPPLATPDEEPRKKGRAAPAGRYHSLISRVSEAEHAAFCASAASSGVKPGRHLHKLIQSYLSGEKPLVPRAAPVAKAKAAPVLPGDAELERFELRLAAFLKTEVKQRAAKEGMSSSEWVAALIQTVVAVDPVLTEREAEAVSFANRELAAVGRNLNQIARSMNRAELIGVNFSKDEILTLQGISILNKKIEKLRSTILSLITARNRAWGVVDDPDS